MPKPSMCWRHVTLGTHNSWLPGEPRGFRTFRHKLHSGGDYKNPPPPGEHAGLYAYSKNISGDVVIIPDSSRPVVGETILKELRDRSYQVLAIAVAGVHTHIQVELPDDLPTIRRILGNCKRAASHAIRKVIEGRVWARDGGYKPIKDENISAMCFTTFSIKKTLGFGRSGMESRVMGEPSTRGIRCAHPAAWPAVSDVLTSRGMSAANPAGTRFTNP